MAPHKTPHQHIQTAIKKIIATVEKTYGLAQEPTFQHVKEYCLRSSKGFRAELLLLSYCGYTHHRPTPQIYSWAASLEIMQDFVLIHDDIIDQAPVRRGGAALHKKIGEKNALVYGDMLFALGVKLFSEIAAPQERKDQALQALLDSAIVTSIGEIKDIRRGQLNTTTRADIYALYDQKTAHYSFVTPLIIGAILGGKNKQEIKNLYQLGICLGRAFQLYDDLDDIHQDIQNATLSLPSFYAYQNATPAEQKKLCILFNKPKKTKQDMAYITQQYQASGVLALVKKEIRVYLEQAQKLLKNLHLRSTEKQNIAQLIEALK